MSVEDQKQQPLRLWGSAIQEKVLTNEHHLKDIFKNLQIFYEQDKFFDVVLIAGIDDIKVQAHRVILCAYSNYFLEICQPDLKEVMLNEIDGATLKSLIHFLYSGSIKLTSEMVERVLKGAASYQIKHLVDICCDFMLDLLDDSNCLRIALFAEKHGYTKLKEQSSTHAHKHLETVSLENNFFQLNSEQLSKLLFKTSSASVYPEEKLFHILVTWIEYDKANREKLIFNLLSNVRFKLLSPNFIVKNRKSVCKSIECYELICSWIEWHLSPESMSIVPTRKIKVALAFGETVGDFKVKSFNLESKQLSNEELPIAPNNRNDRILAFAAMTNKIMIASGINEVGTTSLQCLDLRTMKWNSLPLMPEARFNVVMAELNGDLYVMGGYYYHSAPCSMKKYDFSTGQWTALSSIPSSTWSVQFVTLDDLLYALDDENKTMKCYNPATDQWTSRRFRNSSVRNSGITAVGGYIYAVAGAVNGNSSRQVERYLPATNNWENVQDLHSRISNPRCIALNNRLIAYEDNEDPDYEDTCLSLVQEYDPETDKWENWLPLPPMSCKSKYVFAM